MADLLENARRQRDALGLADYLIVDADAHHFEQGSWGEIVECMPDTVMRNYGRNPRPGRPTILPPAPGAPDLAGRVMRPERAPASATNEHPDVVATRAYMDAFGIHTACLFPTAMLTLGLHPQPEMEANLARAYNRWLVERVIPGDARLRPLLYLPFNVPEACPKVIEEFGDRPGVAGFMVASARHRAVHDNAYVRAYAMLEERGLPLAFHAAPEWSALSLAEANRYLSVYALGFPHFNMLHLANWVVNGLSERFPRLAVVWMEAGLAWLPFLMQRLDSAYLMRSSEAPVLKAPPSEYVRSMYFASHPLEHTGDTESLEFTFRKINAATQLMWASGYPQWNFDLPGAILSLPFLDDAARRNILGRNAARVFRLT
jgi:predicted TIM-barrel fold metal-dependent hydrolase